MTSATMIKTSVSENLQLMASPITAVVWAFAIVLTVLAGPFGTYEHMALLVRVLYWVPVVTLSLFFGYIVRGIVLTLVDQDKPGLFDLVASVILTLIFTPVVILISLGVESLTSAVPPPFPKVVLYIFAVAFAAYVSRRVVVGAEEFTYDFFVKKNPRCCEPRLLRRLDPSIRSRIIRLTGQDHHVEIATEKGVEHLRMRLVDAISEMDDVEGYCTHRSHWVARDQITKVTRENQKISIHLSNGDVVPVSRKYKPTLEEVGIV